MIRITLTSRFSGWCSLLLLVALAGETHADGWGYDQAYDQWVPSHEFIDATTEQKYWYDNVTHVLTPIVSLIALNDVDFHARGTCPDWDDCINFNPCPGDACGAGYYYYVGGHSGYVYAEIFDGVTKLTGQTPNCGNNYLGIVTACMAAGVSLDIIGGSGHGSGFAYLYVDGTIRAADGGPY